MLVSKNQIDLELIKGRINQSFTWLSKSHSPFQRSQRLSFISYPDLALFGRSVYSIKVSLNNWNWGWTRQSSSSFLLSIEFKLWLIWFCFISLCDWSRKRAPLFQPIRCELVARWLAVLTLSSHWQLKVFSFLLIGCCDDFGLVLQHSIEKRSKKFT